MTSNDTPEKHEEKKPPADGLTWKVIFLLWAGATLLAMIPLGKTIAENWLPASWAIDPTKAAMMGQHIQLAVIQLGMITSALVIGTVKTKGWAIPIVAATICALCSILPLGSLDAILRAEKENASPKTTPIQPQPQAQSKGEIADPNLSEGIDLQ